MDVVDVIQSSSPFVGGMITLGGIVGATLVLQVSAVACCSHNIKVVVDAW